MVAKMIPNDSFGRIWDRYNKPWGFRTNLKCLNKVISREPMPIGVATCSDVQLNKRRKIDLKKSIVEKPREEQTHNHGNGEASG